MTNTELIQKIKTEIERLKDENRKIKCPANERYCSGYDDGFYDLLSFLNNLEESEKPNDLDFEQELYNHFGQIKDFTLGMRIAQYFYELGKNAK